MHKSWNGYTGWSGWDSMGGQLVGGPDASAWPCPTSQEFGGQDYYVDTEAEANSVLDAMIANPSASGQLYAGLCPADQTLVMNTVATAGAADVTLGDIDTADGSDGDAVEAGRPDRGCRNTHAHHSFSDNLGHVTMDTRFCWNATKHKAVYDGNNPLLEIDGDISQGYELAGFSLIPLGNKIHYPVEAGGYPDYGVHMESWFDLRYCPIHLPMACDTRHFKYVTEGVYDGRAYAEVDQR